MEEKSSNSKNITKGVLVLAVALAAALAAIALVSCATPAQEGTANPEDSSQAKAGYKTISPEEAKTIMDEAEPYVLLDVRAESEYQEGHIEGATLIPDSELAARAEIELYDKEETILVYCRSGRRSAAAAQLLVDKGYTNVYDFGGITSWPYETVK